MKTTHNHFKYLKKYWSFFEKINTFDKFDKSIIKIAKTISECDNYCYDPDGFSNPNDLKEKIENKVKGDIFEIFVEFFVQYFEHDSDNVFGCKVGTYHCIGDEDDTGMDAYYILNNNEYASVQIKYRSNPNDTPFKKDTFYSLLGAAYLNNYFDKNNENNRLIFVTNLSVGNRYFSKVISPIFSKLMKNIDKQIVILDKSWFLKYNINGNIDFWTEFSNIER